MAIGGIATERLLGFLGLSVYGERGRFDPLIRMQLLLASGRCLLHDLQSLLQGQTLRLQCYLPQGGWKETERQNDHAHSAWNVLT